ncbi:MAG: hypothetical protein E7478_01970 [Ruminococcaceae bacterium]|nr:hypothetical protein [Oscillospiraceae bacterium]
MKKINAIIKQPKYYDKFKCIGGECPASCCVGWDIFWKKDEINKLKECNCSEKLTELINTSFVPSNDIDRYTIALRPNGECPFLTEEKLCLIQKEQGEEYLSEICTVYPRLSNCIYNIATKLCTTSCYAVLDLICHDESSMDIYMREWKGEMLLTNRFKENDIEQHPELLHLNAIFDFLYNIMLDKKHDIETSIILAALAAKKISEFAEDGKADMIPEVIEKLKPQLKDKAQIESINNIKPNYTFSIGVVNDILMKMYGSNVLLPLYTDGIADVDKYKTGMAKFKEFFAENSYAVKNIILNLFMEFFTAYYNKEYTIYDNFLYFVVSAASAKLVAASTGYACRTEKHAQEEFLRSQAVIAHSFVSNRAMIDIITNYLKAQKWHTIGYLASMIK